MEGNSSQTKSYGLATIVCLLFCLYILLLPSPEEASKEPTTSLQFLLNSYPEHLDRIEGDSLIWRDGTKMEISDSSIDKSFDELLKHPSLIDQFTWEYSTVDSLDGMKKNYDPGRIRYLPFFKKMYGETEEEVKENLVEIDWMPETFGKKLLVTSINQVHEKLQAISDELDTIPSLHKYLENPGGTFKWRKIRGTDRLSPHSFGMTIDINVKYANYWQWDCKCKDESVELEYQNSIPHQIVKIFEKYGFIWGGKWYHYDTMHFEYRPELLVER